MQITIDAERLAAVKALAFGSHGENSATMCAMEAAAYIAREPWSDHPECVCPVIGAFMRSWNDALPDEDRTRLLLPLIAKTIGTRGSADLANRRAIMATDWLIRVNTPAWLRVAGLTTQADALANLPEITDFAKTPGLMPTLEAVRAAAGTPQGQNSLTRRLSCRSAPPILSSGCARSPTSQFPSPPNTLNAKEKTDVERT